MNLLGYDYCADRPDPSIGLEALSVTIRRARAEALDAGAACLLLDNGDGLQGTPLGDQAAADDAGGHPLIRAFAALGYDAVGLGNHDFDFGLETLAGIVGQAPFPVVSSNLIRLGETGFWQRHCILERGFGDGRNLPPVRIGILSVLPPQTMRWNARQLAGKAIVEDSLVAARRQARQLRAAGCDLVLVLAHAGLGDAAPGLGAENTAVAIAAIDDVGAVIAGHSHQLYPAPGDPATDARAETGGDTALVLPGAAGAYLGIVDLDLILGHDRRYRVAGHRTALRAGGGLPATDMPDIAGIAAGLHGKTRRRMNRPVGNCPVPLHSYFAVLAPDRSLAVTAVAQAAALRPHLDGTDAAGLPLLSAAAPCKTGGRSGPNCYSDVPAGPVSMRHVADLSPYANEVRALLLCGAQLRDWLDMAASLFNRIDPGGRSAPLVNPAYSAQNFDVIHGLEYAIDLTAPARFAPDGREVAPGTTRIARLRWSGRPVPDRQMFAVATNSFRTSGGGNVRALDGARKLATPIIDSRSALSAYLSGSGARDPLERAPAPWRFLPMPGTRVVAETAPRAARHLGELAAYRPRRLGIDDRGFLRLSLAL